MQGFSHPIMFDRRKKSSIIISGTDVISSYLKILLLSDNNELQSDPNYGCLLKSLIYSPNDSILVDLVKDSLVKSISIYAKSIIVKYEDIDRVQDNESMKISVGYSMSDRSESGVASLQILNSEVTNV